MSAVEPPVDGADSLVGAVINGKYHVTELIGRGGMGSIYRAEQQPLGRVVAIKTLLKTEVIANDPSFQRRFFLEASLCAKLSHPNIVTIHDYGKIEGDASEAFFIAMEFLEGETLARRLKRRHTLDLNETLWLSIEIARGLREAHRGGVVHRDLKPGNVMLVPDVEHGDRVKILDFGLVKQLAGNEPEDLTQQGSFIGSPRYMAPEQVNGDAVDHRTDLYALGIIMYRCLAGREPYVSPQSMQVLLGHLQEPVPPMREVNPGLSLPPSIDAIVMRLLEKKPERRHPDADALVRDLRRAQEEAGVIPSGPTGQSRFAPVPEGTGPHSLITGSGRIAPPSATPAPVVISPDGRGDLSSGVGARVPGEIKPHAPGTNRSRAPVALLGVGLIGLGAAAVILWLGPHRHPAGPPSAARTSIDRAPAPSLPVPVAPLPAPAVAPAAAVEAPTAIGSTRGPPEALHGTAPMVNAAHRPTASTAHVGAHSPGTLRPGPSTTVPLTAPPAVPAHPSGNVTTPATEEFGFLSLDSSPWSQVTTEGRSLGTTPLVRVRLAAGTHVLTLHNPEVNITTQYPVTIRANETVSRRIGLE